LQYNLNDPANVKQVFRLSLLIFHLSAIKSELHIQITDTKVRNYSIKTDFLSLKDTF